MLTYASLVDVKEAIRGTPGERFLDDNAGAMPTNLLATLTAHLEAFAYLPEPPTGSEGFSIKDFIKEDADRWLFIMMRADDEAAIRPLISMWYDLAINAVLALPAEAADTPTPKRRRIWAVLDELARLQRLPALEGGLREGRAKGLACILGLQSMGDVRAAYGRDKAEALLGQPQTRLILRTVEPDTAGWLERLLGKAEMLKTQESQSMGGDAQRDGVSIQRQIRSESVVLASEIQNLPDLQGYMKLPTGPIYKVAYGTTARKRRAEGFVPRMESPLEGSEKTDLGDILARLQQLAERSVDAAISLALEELDARGPSSVEASRRISRFIEQLEDSRCVMVDTSEGDESLLAFLS